MLALLTSVWLYRLAFAWNLFWGLPLLLAPDFALSTLDLPAPQPGVSELYARGVGLAVALFGLVYLTIGHDPRAFRPFLVIAILAKVGFFVLVLLVYIRSPEIYRLLLVSVGDLIFGLLFFADWRRRSAS